MQEDVFDFWCRPQHAENEDDMEAGHQSSWQSFIRALPADLTGKTVLDFGCNQGAFLRLLYSQKPFKQGVGVDLAREAINIAQARKGALPLHYHNTGRPDKLGQQFDICISTSVLYFIADFAEHARIISDSLTDHGCYYASFTDVNGSPMLPVWQKYLLANNVSVPFRVQSMDDIVNNFLAEGFNVDVKRTVVDFIPMKIDHSDKNTVVNVKDMIELAYERSYIFRFSKKAE